jgi:hypothetical protein
MAYGLSHSLHRERRQRLAACAIPQCFRGLSASRGSLTGRFRGVRKRCQTTRNDAKPGRRPGALQSHRRDDLAVA